MSEGKHTTEIGVYAIIHRASGKRYIGSAAVSIKNRWYDHRKQLRGNRHHSRYLQRAWNKYGEDAFEFVVVEQCESEKCVEREQFWMDRYRSAKKRFGYNVCPTAGSQLGKRRSPEQRKRIGDGKRGIKPRPETTAKRRAAILERHETNLVGQRFDSLVVTEVVPYDRQYVLGGKSNWKRRVVCQCDCGKTIVKIVETLRYKRPWHGHSCGCQRRHHPDSAQSRAEALKSSWAKRKKTIIGLRFGKLVVTEVVQEGKRRLVRCACDCGNTCVRGFDNLKHRENQVSSCGCARVITEEFKAKMSAKFKGVPRSPEVVAKIRAGHMRRKFGSRPEQRELFV